MIPALLLYMLLFPKKVLADSLAGLDLWFHTVLPSLLPFMILSNVLIGANVVSQLMRPFSGFFRHVLGLSPEGGYAWLLGLFCGFPMGARLTGDMYRQHRISREEAGYLLTFALGGSVALQYAVAVAGFVLGIIFAIRYDRRLRARGGLSFTIVRLF